MRIYEIHTNLFVTATSFDEAKEKAKLLPEFRLRKMHVDGMQEIEQVDGLRVRLDQPGSQSQAQSGFSTETIIHSKRSSFARIKKQD